MVTATDKPIQLISERLVDCGLFDVQWYLDEYKWVAKERINPINHYVESGEVNNRLPNIYFHPGWYRKKYLANTPGVLNCLLHYFQVGRFKGFSPSPYFDSVAYAKLIGTDLKPEDALGHWLAGDRQVNPPANEQMKLEVEIDKTGLFLPMWYKKLYMKCNLEAISPIEHYTVIGSIEGYKPNPYFDPIWYTVANPHVSESGEHPLIHYAKHGWRNGKIPSPRFQSTVYSSTNIYLKKFEDGEVEPLNYYLYSIDKSSSGREETKASGYSGVSFSQEGADGAVYRDFLSEPGFRLLQYFSGEAGKKEKIRQEFSKRLTTVLEQKSKNWLKNLQHLELFTSIYHPFSSDSLNSEKILYDYVDYVKDFDKEATVPTGFFDPSYFRIKTGSQKSDADCLRDWVCAQRKIIPNRYFNHQIYRKSSGTQLESAFDVFLDWMYDGVYKNCVIGNLVDIQYLQKIFGKTDDVCVFVSFLMSKGVVFSEKHQSLEHVGGDLTGAELLTTYFHRHGEEEVRIRLKSGVLNDQILAAAELDSKVLERGLDIPISAPPFNSALAPVVKRIRCSLPKAEYDTVILIPHCRMSGATKIAGKLAESLVSLKPDRDLLIVMTDLDINKHPEWFPGQADVYSLANEIQGIEVTQRESALFDLLVGVNARNVVNVNSALGWQVFEKYGSRLATEKILSAYLFCYDLNKDGTKVGYPSRHFVSSLSYLKKVFFDSDYLRKEVIKKNMISDPQDIAKLKTLYTPVGGLVNVYSEIPKKTAEVTKIYWAGRLDRQKNFDLVIRISKLLSEIEFHCWGESVIGDYKLGELPKNLILNQPFNNIDEIDLDQCDLWLYTSMWDGIPNLLLEVGGRGIPLVSTSVWGVADLVTEANSWPVSSIEDEELYVRAILNALCAPEESRVKAELLQSLVKERHSFSHYMNQILECFYEDSHESD